MKTLSPEVFKEAEGAKAVLGPVAKPRSHLDFIDGLRGLAIAQVLVFHVWEYSHSPVSFWWNPISWGYTGVTLFLLLSGFCLYWPMVRPDKPSLEPSLKEFAARRAHRIYPPYFIVLAICTAVDLVCIQLHRSWWDAPLTDVKSVGVSFLWHALMIHNLRAQHIFTIDGPFWSLALEVSLYVAMPLLVYLARVRGIVFTVVCCALITLTYRCFCEFLVGGTNGWVTGLQESNFALVNFLPGQMVVFALGMWAAKLVGSNTVKLSVAALGTIAVVVLATAAWIQHYYTRYNPISDSLFAIAYFAILLLVSRPSHFLGSAMRWRPLVWLGQISYSVYLIHYPIMKAIYIESGIENGLDRYAVMIGTISLPVIVGIAYIFHICCERPFMNGPRKTGNGLRYASPVSATELSPTRPDGESAIGIGAP